MAEIPGRRDFAKQAKQYYKNIKRFREFSEHGDENGKFAEQRERGKILLAIRRKRRTAQNEQADGATTVPLLAYDDRLV
ncbi:hypothetical protein [Leptospira noguchii]|uniref:hypothetical protein n=1 Tax=Leptospira noguchii TaxID=28182 RepID=UPI000774B550|nr:hypothetical protein [Leptospira noguchii]